MILFPRIEGSKTRDFVSYKKLDVNYPTTPLWCVKNVRISLLRLLNNRTYISTLRVVYVGSGRRKKSAFIYLVHGCSRLRIDSDSI